MLPVYGPAGRLSGLSSGVRSRRAQTGVRTVFGPEMTGTALALPFLVAKRLGGIERRQSPRIDVLRRVHGRLVEIDTQIIIHDLSRTGFSVVSEIAFEPGQNLDFRLTSDDGTTVTVCAEAVHSRPMPASPELVLTGFRFVPGRLTGMVPQSRIDRLIAAVIDAKVQFFESA